MKRTILRAVWGNLQLAVIYFIVGKLGLMLALPPGYTSPIWPAAGVALIGILLGGYRLGFGIFLGSFAFNFYTSLHSFDFDAVSKAGSIGGVIALGAALQALSGTWLVKRFAEFKKHNHFTQSNLPKLLIYGGPIGCLVSSTVGVSTLLFSGTILPNEFFLHWATWWIGDSLGALVVLYLFFKSTEEHANNEEYKIKNNFLDQAALFLGWMVSLLGVCALIGWFTGTKSLTQAFFNLVAMAPNTAACFIFSALSLICFIKEYKKLAVSFAFFSIIVGGLTLSEHIFGVQFPIDQLLFKTDLSSPFPGRMAPNTALAFLLIGNACIWSVKGMQKIPAILTSLTVVLGLIPFISYCVGMKDVHSWGGFPLMALHTSVGLILLGSGFFIQIFWKSVYSFKKIPSWLPEVSGIGTIAATLILWNVAVHQEQLHIKQTMNSVAEEIKINIERRFEARIQGLIRMAQRWEFRGSMSKDEWETDATHYYQDYTSYQAIEWIDPSMTIRWVVPLQGNESVVNKNLSEESFRRAAFEKAIATHQAQVSRVVELLQGGKGMLAVIPIKIKGKNEGFIVGVVSITKLLKTILSQNFLKKYYLYVFEDERLIFSNFGNSPQDQLNSSELFAMDMGGSIPWKMMVQANEKTIQDLQSFFPHLVLGVGLSLSLLFFIALHFALKAQILALQAQAAEERYRSITETAHDGIIIADSDENIIYANQEAQEMFGYTKRSLENLDLKTLILLPAKEENLKVVDFLASHQSFIVGNVVQLTGCKKTKEEFPIEFSLATWTFLEKRYLTIIIRNITKQKKMEQSLIDAKNAAEAGTKAKADFLATMSHEIRTPMNGIMGMTDLLFDTPLNQQQKEFVQTIQICGGSLLTIINDILDYSKIEAGRLSLEKIKVNLHTLVKEVVALFLLQAKNKGIELFIRIENDVQPGITTDPVRLKQVLMNLVGNALKFTKKGSVSIQITKVEEQDTSINLRFSVKDTGIGISEENFKKLFKPFTQADASITRKFGGTGLGLVISKNLVEIMGGELIIESVAQKGSTFWFEVPFEKCALESISEHENLKELDVTPTKEIIKLLVVEDNEINQEILKLQLKKWSYRTDFANSGKEAIELARIKTYDIILMDCQMPELSGYDTTRIIRQTNNRNQKTPIIALTAEALEGSRENCLQAGMNDYLSKPVNFEKLRKMLNTWTKEHQASPLETRFSEFKHSENLLILNKEFLEETFEGNQAMIQKLIQKFGECAPPLIKDIETAWQRQDWSEVGRLAHTLRGSIGSLGGERAANLLKEIEHKIKKDESPGNTYTWPTIDKVLHEFFEKLKLI